MKEQYKILLGQILAHMALVPMIAFAGLNEWLCAFFVYFLMMTFGISFMNHRVLSHNTIEVKSKTLEYFSLFMATISLQGSSLAWVSMHREHHAYSDTEKDPHSPSHDGFFSAYFLSMLHMPNVKKYGRNLLRHKSVIWFHKHFWKVNISYSLFLFMIFGFMGPLVFHLIPAVFQWHGSSMVNGLAHYHKKVPSVIGYRNFETKELSKNLPLFGYITFGEGWHNNHHGKVNSYTFKYNWWEFDLVASIAYCFHKMKLVEIKNV